MKDTIMWLVGIALALFAAGMMFWSNAAAAPLIVVGIVGVVFIAVGATGRRGEQR